MTDQVQVHPPETTAELDPVDESAAADTWLRAGLWMSPQRQTPGEYGCLRNGVVLDVGQLAVPSPAA